VARFACIALAGVVCSCGGTDSTGGTDGSDEGQAPQVTATRSGGGNSAETPGPQVTSEATNDGTATATATATPTATPTVSPTPTGTDAGEDNP
jgi:hypothetical protein